MKSTSYFVFEILFSFVKIFQVKLNCNTFYIAFCVLKLKYIFKNIYIFYFIKNIFPKSDHVQEIISLQIDKLFLLICKFPTPCKI